MFDVLIKGGLVIDGTGKPGYLANVAVSGGKIAAVERNLNFEIPAATVLDATGMVVAPGFIDIHSHTDRTITKHPGAGSSLLQGITTEISGNCGGSMAPINDKTIEMFKRLSGKDGVPELPWRSFGEFLEHVDKLRPGTNQGLFVGQGTIRACVMGREKRYPSEDELTQMKGLVRQALEEGAFGISTGRAYVPGCYGSFREIVELCRVAGEYDGLHTSHIQDQWSKIHWSVTEIVEITRRADVRGQVAHMKVVGKDNWGRAGEILSILENARSRGLDVLADVYPYTYSQVILLRNLLPKEFSKMEPDKLRDALSAPGASESLRKAFEADPGYATWRFDRMGIIHCSRTKEFEGMDIGEAALALGLDVFSAVVKILLENDLEVKTAGIMSEADVRKIVAHPLVMFGTDALTGDPEKDASPGYSDLHPRHYGTYPRILGMYVREERALSLEEAVRKMTSMPAERLNILDRGLIHRGYWADVVIFDPLTVRDRADLDHPAAPPVGIKYVLVNGEIAVKDSKLTGLRAGKVLRAAHHRIIY